MPLVSGFVQVIEAAGEAEIAQLQPQRVRIDQHVLGGDIAVNQPAGMHVAECRRQLQRDAELVGQAQRAQRRQLRQIGRSEVFKHQHVDIAGLTQAERADHPFRIDALQHVVFVLPARAQVERRMRRILILEHHAFAMLRLCPRNYRFIDGINDFGDGETCQLHASLPCVCLACCYGSADLLAARANGCVPKAGNSLSKLCLPSSVALTRCSKARLSS